MTNEDFEMPPLLTAEEAERKAAMLKATEEVAEAADSLKTELERRGWSLAEQAALTLFNTLLMTAFGEEMKQKQDGRDQEVKSLKERSLDRAVSIAVERGFKAEDVTRTCVGMLLEGRPEEQAGAIWEDYYGEGSKGVLFSILVRTSKELEEEDRKERERRGESS